MIQRLDSLINLQVDPTQAPYFYAVVNGASPSGSLACMYQHYEVKNCASLFTGTQFQGNEDAGPWLLQLESISPDVDYPCHTDWGFYLFHAFDFKPLLKLLQLYLTAETDHHTVLVRWWDPRILFHLLQGLAPEARFNQVIGHALLNYQNLWYIKPCNLKEFDYSDTMENTPWILQDTDFASYRQSDYYINQLALTISENWLRFDEATWRSFNSTAEPLCKQLIPIIKAITSHGVNEFEHIDTFCHLAVKHQKSSTWLLERATHEPTSWLAKTLKDVT